MSVISKENKSGLKDGTDLSSSECSASCSAATYPNTEMHFLSSHCRPGRWVPGCRLALTPCPRVSGHRWTVPHTGCAHCPPGREGTMPRPAVHGRCCCCSDKGLRGPLRSSSLGSGKVVRWSGEGKTALRLQRSQHPPQPASVASDLYRRNTRWRRPPASCRCRSSWPAGRTRSSAGCSASQWWWWRCSGSPRPSGTGWRSSSTCRTRSSASRSGWPAHTF